MREGQQVSNYRILEKLGRGGMGVVYKAEDTVLGRTVALKFFLPELLEDSEAKERLVREARAASVLDHPSVCTVHEVREVEDGRVFICMGYCEGETLRERLRRRLPAMPEALGIAIQIAEGLSHAHGRGIIHRDIKPENIVISPDGRARIMDFGLAKLAGESKITKEGMVTGTLAYMSPEQVKGGEVDHRTDVWSLGIILYELLTGKTPFGGMYEAAALYSIVNERPVSPSEINAAIPSELEDIVLRTLEKRPGGRYQSMKEMAEDLKRVHSGIPGDVDSVIPIARRRTKRQRSRRKTMIAALVSTAVAVSAIFYVGTLSVDADPVSVAVLDFKNTAGEEGLDGVVAGLLTQDLEESPRISVLKRERMRELQSQMGIETVDERAGFAIAKKAGVQVLISGEVEKTGDGLRVNAGVYDVATEKLICTKRENGNGRDAVFDMVDNLSSDIRKELKVVPRWGGESEPPLEITTTKSIDAFRLYATAEDTLYSKGQELRDSRPQEAAAFMKQAVAQDPNFAEAYMELAMLHKHQLQKPEEALQYALRAKELSKTKPNKEYLKSLIYEAWMSVKAPEDWDMVIEYMRQYLDLQPNDMRVQRRLGWVLGQRETTYQDAIIQLKSVIEELDPNNLSGEVSRACNHLGNVYMHMGNFEEAFEVFEHYKALLPNLSGPLHSLGNAYMLSGRYQEAIGQLWKSVDNNPRYYPSYESLGMSYLAMGKWRDAIDAFMRYLAAAPEGYSARARVRVAQVHCEQANYTLAREEIEEALLSDDTSVEAHWMKGLISLATEGSATARRELEALEEIVEKQGATAENAYLLHLSGRMRLAEGERDKAIKDLLQAVEESPRFEKYEFKVELVRGYLEAGHAEDAISKGLTLLEYNPNDGEVLSIVASAYEKNGAPEEATSYLERALDTWKDADRDFLPLKAAQAKL